MQNGDPNTIEFTSTGKYMYFVNEYPIDIELEGKIWPSIEHYIQAKKYENIDDEYMELIRTTKELDKVMLLSSDKSKKIRADWHIVKLDIMFSSMLIKFESNEYMKDLLLSTDPKYLCYKHCRDSSMGDGSDGRGKNLLGKFLMEVRDHIKINNKV